MPTIHEIGLFWLHITLEKVSRKGAGNLPLLDKQLDVAVAFLMLLHKEVPLRIR